MKPMTLAFALAAMASAMPCTAQPGPAQSGGPLVRFVPGNTSPQEMQATLNSLFRAARTMHHAGLMPQETAKIAAIRSRLDEMQRSGADALRSGDFIGAEATFRILVEEDSLTPESHYGLGDALAGQGRAADAIASYRVAIYMPLNADKSLSDIPLMEPSRGRLRGCQNQTTAVCWMKCALLLSQTGQGAEAIAIYNQALPRVPDWNQPGMSLALTSDTPAPETFQAAAHIALGLCATFSGDPIGGAHEKAMSEFDAARRLQPSLPLTNYYYGYGWEHLDLKSAARQAYAAQAKAAFQQAAALGEGTVKKEAEQALVSFK